MSMHSNLKNSIHTLYLQMGRADMIEQLPEVESQDQAYERWLEKVKNKEIMEHVTIQYEKGIDLENRRKFKKARKLYESLLAEYPDFTNAHCRLGYVLDSTKKFADAIDVFIRALEIDPEFDLVYFRTGQLMKMVGRVDEAETIYRKVIELNPRVAAARNNLGLILIDKKDWEGAKEQFRAILEDFPNAQNAKKNLRAAEKKRGRGGCFIATAAIGSDAAFEVDVLREFRDTYLFKSTIGQAIVKIYYTISPQPAKWIARHNSVRVVVRRLIIYPAIKLICLFQKK
ncbi:MAG: CFI-box-CTERM domain-containing protein [Candidatus Humimicrobiia bacterium]